MVKEKYLIIFNNNTKKNFYEIQKALKNKQFLIPEFLGFKEEYEILITYFKLINYFRSINISDKVLNKNYITSFIIEELYII